MLKKIAVLLFLVIAYQSQAKDKDINFTDKSGQNIDCQVDSNGQSNCKNSNQQTVICGNDDNDNYICSSNQ